MNHPHSPGSGRPKLDIFRAGHVFVLPEGATWLNRDKPRPFVLATRSSSAQLGAFVYGSTRRTEMMSAAACTEVMPVSSGVNANGLRAPTLFYPGLLLPIEYDILPPHAGVLGPKLAGFKAALVQAVGLGTGTCAHPSAPLGSRRGRIVTLPPLTAAKLQSRYAVVLTEHAYSRQKRYQLIVPVIRGDGSRAAPNIVRVHGKEWLQLFAQPTSSALLAASVIQSVWHRDDIVSETRFVIDIETLEALEERLCALFEIELSRD